MNGTTWPKASRVLRMIRRATTAATTTHGIGGRPKDAGHAPKAVSLAKVKFQEEEGKR